MSAFCTHCVANASKVIDSRVLKDGTTRRRRKCLNCGLRWTTHEITVSDGDNIAPTRDREKEKLLAIVKQIKEAVRERSMV